MKALSRVQGSVVNISSEGSAWSEQVDDYNEADCPGDRVPRSSTSSLESPKFEKDGQEALKFSPRRTWNENKLFGASLFPTF